MSSARPEAAAGGTPGEGLRCGAGSFFVRAEGERGGEKQGKDGGSGGFAPKKGGGLFDEKRRKRTKMKQM